MQLPLLSRISPGRVLPTALAAITLIGAVALSLPVAQAHTRKLV